MLAVRPDAMVATGRTDYPNQINNVLGFPFIFRGALDVRARAINDEMKMAATRALAELARLDVPESVEKAYGNERFRFGAEYLIPKPFDPRIMLCVAPAVAKAAMDTGVARVQIDLEQYRAELIARLGRGREVMRDIMRRARQRPRRIVYPEGENARIIRACALVLGEGIATPVLVGRPDVIRERARTLGVSVDGAEIVDHWADEARREQYAQEFFRRRQRKGVTLAQARERMREPVFFGCMMVLAGDADGLLAGEDMYYPETIRPALEVIGTAPGVRRVAGLYMLVLEREMIFFADTTVNIDPDARHAGGDGAAGGGLRAAAGAGAARGHALVQQLRLGAQPAERQGARRHGAGEAAGPGAGDRRRDAGGHGGPGRLPAGPVPVHLPARAGRTCTSSRISTPPTPPTSSCGGWGARRRSAPSCWGWATPSTCCSAAARPWTC